jgi:hypothetical protein
MSGRCEGCRDADGGLCLRDPKAFPQSYETRYTDDDFCGPTRRFYTPKEQAMTTPRYRLTWREYLYGTIGWRIEQAKLWCLRWVYAQHNARVIEDFESRMVAVAYEGSGGMMSKPYYTKEAMIGAFQDYQNRQYDEAYQEGRRDLADELDVKLDEQGQVIET